MRQNHLFCLLQKPLLQTLASTSLAMPTCSLLFSSANGVKKKRGRSKEKEREEDKEMVIRLSLLGSLDGVLH